MKINQLQEAGNRRPYGWASVAAVPAAELDALRVHGYCGYPVLADANGDEAIDYSERCFEPAPVLARALTRAPFRQASL